MYIIMKDTDSIVQPPADRRQIGERHWQARLFPRDIPEIRELLAEGYSATFIARQFGVTKGCIYRIKSGHNWKHVDV